MSAQDWTPGLGDAGARVVATEDVWGRAVVLGLLYRGQRVVLAPGQPASALVVLTREHGYREEAFNQEHLFGADPADVHQPLLWAEMPVARNLDAPGWPVPMGSVRRLAAKAKYLDEVLTHAPSLERSGKGSWERVLTLPADAWGPALWLPVRSLERLS